MSSNRTEGHAKHPDLDAYSGPFLIDHLDDAIAHRDVAAAKHFFSVLLPMSDTHETVARILCRRNAPGLLKALLTEGYWPSVDMLRELLGVSAAAGSCDVMYRLLDLAADRGVECGALAAGWVNALAGQARTGSVIQRINARCPGSVTEQAVVCALESAHPRTLDAVLRCLLGDHLSDEQLDAEHESIGSLVHECVAELTGGTATTLLAHGLDPRITGKTGKTLIERVFSVSSVSAEVRAVFERWVRALPDGQAMAVYVSIGDDEAFAQRCCQQSSDSLAGFDAQAALTKALSRDHIALARVLLTMGAKVNGECGSDSSPLLTATAAGATECVELLLNAKADPDACVDINDSCCLTLASSKGYSRIVCLLLAAGADPSRRDDRGNTALHYCSVRGDIDLCARLLRAGAELEAQNSNDGNTPLTLACIHTDQRDNHDVIGFLLDMGANVESRNSAGKSALELASIWRQADLVNALLRREAGNLSVNGTRKLHDITSHDGLTDHSGLQSHVRSNGMSGLKSIALKMISLAERAKSSRPAQAANSVTTVESGRDFDQAA